MFIGPDCVHFKLKTNERVFVYDSEWSVFGMERSADAAAAG